MKINQFDKNPKIAERRIEDSSDFPEEGNNIRTNSGNMEGKVIRVDGNMVYFKLADGRPMKTSIRNVTVIEKLADGDDEIMEDELNEISNEVLARYKQGAAAQAGEADLKGDIKKADKRFSGIIKATKKQFANDKKQCKQGVTEGMSRDEYNQIQYAIDNFKDEYGEDPTGPDIFDIADSIGVEPDAVINVLYGRVVPDQGVAEADDKKEWQKQNAKPKQLGKTEKYFSTRHTTKDTGAADKEQGVAEDSAHGYNVVRYYEKNGDQLKLTRWLRKEAGLEKDAPVYFDDADLVYGDKTIVPNALVNPKLKFNDLLTALTQATGGQGKQKVDGVYREQGVEEDQLNELNRKTVISYVPKRIDSAKALARTDYDKAKRITQKDIPRALTKLRDKNYGHAKKSDVEENEEINNPADTITVDVPLLIRIMEYAKEDAKTDLDLHNAAERLIELSQEGRTLTMDDYATMIGDVKEGGMGGINRCAPANDVSYQDILNDVTDKWRGDTVTVKEMGPYAARFTAFFEAWESKDFSNILNKQHKETRPPAKAEVKRIPLSNPNFFLQFRPQTDNLRPLGWQVRGKNAPDDILQQGTSSNLKDATQEAEKWLATKSGATASSNHVTINFNAAFAKQFAQGGETLWCDIWEGPMLVFSTEPQEGFKKTVIRTPEHNRSQGAALLPVMGISPKEANKAGLDGNSRYKLGPQEDLGDGVHAYALEWDSKIEKGERKIFKEPILQTSTSLEEETITELDKSTLGSYIKKASRDVADTSSGEGFKAAKKNPTYNTADDTPKEKKRLAGIGRAADKLAK